MRSYDAVLLKLKSTSTSRRSLRLLFFDFFLAVSDNRIVTVNQSTESTDRLANLK